MTVQNRETKQTLSEDVEERGPLVDRILFWLLKHPYQGVSDLSFIFHVHGSTIWRQIQTLLEHVLVESVTPSSVTSSRPETLYYLTTGGIKRVADLVGDVDAMKLAQLWQVHESALLHLLPRLASYRALEQAIVSIIADAPHQLSYPGGRPATIRWHWQRDYTHVFERKKKRMTVRTDGAVVFRRRPLQEDGPESWYCFVLFVDPGFRGSEDLRLMRKRMEQVLHWRESSERWSFYHTFPPVLVLTQSIHQRDLWIRCAQEASAHLRVAPLKGASALLVNAEQPWRLLWQSLDGSGRTTLQSLADPLVPQAIPPGLLAPKQIERVGKAKGKKRERAIVIGNFEARAKLLKMSENDLKTTAEIALLSMRVSHRHTDLLLHLYAIPLVSSHELAALVQRDQVTLERYLYDLQLFRCLMTVKTSYGNRLVLTEVGLRLITLIVGVQLVHIAEFVEEEETHQWHWQQRGVRQMLRMMKHTAGIYIFLAELQLQARKIGQEVMWWETTRSLRRYHLQGAWHNLMPDALFEYQTKEGRVEAWLEWDTGSMHRYSLKVKFEAYAQYVRSQYYRRDHRIPPTLLLVAPHTSREQVVRSVVALVLDALPLKIWTTTESLLKVQGPLAAIWKSVRDSDSEKDAERSHWIKKDAKG